VRRTAATIHGWHLRYAKDTYFLREHQDKRTKTTSSKLLTRSSTHFSKSRFLLSRNFQVPLTDISKWLGAKPACCAFLDHCTPAITCHIRHNCTVAYPIALSSLLTIKTYKKCRIEVAATYPIVCSVIAQPLFPRDLRLPGGGLSLPQARAAHSSHDLPPSTTLVSDLLPFCHYPSVQFLLAPHGQSQFYLFSTVFHHSAFSSSPVLSASLGTHIYCQYDVHAATLRCLVSLLAGASCSGKSNDGPFHAWHVVRVVLSRH
jgi:hypothetical protein